MSRTETAVFFFVVIVLLCVVVFGGVAAAQDGLSAPVGVREVSSEGNQVLDVSSHETSWMVIVLTVVVLGGGIVTGLLMRLRLIKNFVWALPIMAALAGVAWGLIAALGVEDAPRLSRFARFMFLFLAYVCALWGVVRLAFPWDERRTRKGLPPLLRNVIVLVLAFAGLLVLLQRTFPGVDLTPLLLTSGALSVVVGLALKELVENQIAGIVLSIQRPFKVGDWIDVSNTEGEVAEINWRATIIRTRRNDHVRIPNSTVMREKVVNYDRPAALHKRYIEVGVTYETPPGVTVRALLEAAERVEGVLTSPPSEAHFLKYADSSLVYQLRVWIDNFASMPEIESDVRKAIWYSFKRHGITIPFPQRDVHMRQVQEAARTCHARLAAISGLPRGTVFVLEKASTTIGREENNDIVLIDPRVSNDHAVIKCEKNHYVIRDLDSSHGTLLNGKAIKSSVLSQGDEIKLGSVVFTYESNLVQQSAEQQRILDTKT